MPLSASIRLNAILTGGERSSLLWGSECDCKHCARHAPDSSLRVVRRWLHKQQRRAYDGQRGSHISCWRRRGCAKQKKAGRLQGARVCSEHKQRTARGRVRTRRLRSLLRRKVMKRTQQDSRLDSESRAWYASLPSGPTLISSRYFPTVYHLCTHRISSIRSRRGPLSEAA